MSTDSKTRTISYLRAVWPSALQPPPTIQGVLNTCLAGLSNAGTTLPLRDGHAQVRHWCLHGQELRVHIAAWTDQEPVSTVPHIQNSGSDLAEETPGSDWEYLDGDGMILVRDNHCLLMPSGLHLSSIKRYLKNLVAHGVSPLGIIPSAHEGFHLQAIADSKTIEFLDTQGIKKIQLNIGQYLETTRERVEQQEKTVWRLGRQVASSLFLKEEHRKKVEESQNVHATLVVGINARKPGLTPEEFAPIGQRLLDESESDIEIETQEGHRIRRGELLLKKTVKVRSFAKTVHHNDAWELMSEYLQDLEDSGVLEL